MVDGESKQLGNYRLIRLVGQGGFAESIWASRCITTTTPPSKSSLPTWLRKR
jgi:hypothetical protein